MKTEAKRTQILEAGLQQIDESQQLMVSCLGDALDSLGKKDLMRFLPWVGEVPNEMPPEGIQQLYSIGFQLLNMVEERIAVRTRRQREQDLGASSVRGLWSNTIEQMVEMGLSEDEIIQILEKVDVEPVFTAHPTEAKRTSVRESHREIYELMVDLENTGYTEREKDRIKEELAVNLESLWLTGEIHVVRPELKQELENAMFYLREMFPKVINKLNENLLDAWTAAGFSPEKLINSGARPLLQFGIWIGGDRDGHPLVTSEVTEYTLSELRKNALILVREEVQALQAKLSMSKHFQHIPSTLENRIQHLANEFKGEEEVAVIATKYNEEPWRQLLALMDLKLSRDIENEAGGYNTPDLFLEDLSVIEESLKEINCQLIVNKYVRPVRLKIEIFGFYLARLDIRQNSDFHDKAVTQLLVASGVEDGENFSTWDEEKRIEFLTKELESPRPFLHDHEKAGPEACAVLDCYRVVVSHYEKYGNKGLGSLIVSMTRKVSDLLCVYILQREAGLLVRTETGLASPLEVVPLFETMDDLDRSPGLMKGFIEHPVTQRSLKLRHPDGNPEMQTMLGYSDSNKDCGILAASWALYRAQTALSELAREKGITFKFFHGRGGTISRGAGPTRWFMAALPSGSLSGGFRMTEQGETIAQKYGNLANATFNTELLLACTALTTAQHHKEPQPKDELNFMDELCSHSEAAYQEFLTTDGFIEFFRQATPIDTLENARIGSRPARRKGQKEFSLDDLRAIPWVFSWTQSRCYLPGWYGVGTALNKLKEEKGSCYNGLLTAIKSSSYLQYVLNNVEQSLASANLDLIKEYASMVENAEIRDRFVGMIEAEFVRTQEIINELLGAKLEERRPRMTHTLEIREKALDVLHRQQVALIKEWRGLLKAGETEAAELMFPKILLSINAISSGLRTTG